MSKIKWGVLGTAYICERDTFPGMLQADNCELYAIAGRNPEKVAAFQEKYGFAKTYLSFDQLLADPEVQAVYVPLPNEMHYQWALKALNAKKHVLCEKPMTPTAAETAALFQAAEANGVYLMEAFAFQHSPYLAALRAEIASGAIGKVRYMESAYITSDYDLSNIRVRRETLGGCTYDLGVYNTSLIQRLLDDEPTRVQAIGTFSPEKIDKLTSVIMDYADGKQAVFTCGMTLATEKNWHLDRFAVHGELGSIRSGSFAFNAPGTLTYIVTDANGVETTKAVECPQNYRLEVEQLGRCILSGESPAVTAEFSKANARTIDKILQAIGY